MSDSPTKKGRKKAVYCWNIHCLAVVVQRLQSKPTLQDSLARETAVAIYCSLRMLQAWIPLLLCMNTIECKLEIKMAEMSCQQGKAIGFKSVRLLKGQALGIGSYGKVCKAKCDDLLCAAKLIHETLFAIDPTAQQLIAPQREHRLPMRRFEQECEFLSTIRHPNIVLYLGIYRDPDTGLPALLMELMDNNLTHFLESSPQPIPYHIQVNICHDISRALSFLHSNEIIHRDLSSNNVLLIGNVRAKVADFGMAKLNNQNLRATQLSFTKCPGTDVYMPPEAVQDKPEYAEKIDCFSFGVITLQILTREFPKPGDRRKRIAIDLPRFPKGTLIEAQISEVDRRQNHISTIDPNHTLLPIALDCLKDRDVERPSAQHLCERVAALKEDPQYIREVETKSTAEQRLSGERERELRQQHNIQQVQGLQQIIQSQIGQLDEQDKALREKEETIAAGQQQLRRQINENRQLEREKSQIIEKKERELRQKVDEISRLEREKSQGIEENGRELRQKVDKISRLDREKNQVIEEKERLERQLGCVNQQLKESELVIAQFQRRITELEQMKLATDTTPRSKKQSSSRASIKLTWSFESKKSVPAYEISYHRHGAADGSILYVRVNYHVYGYSISTSSWSQLQIPDCPSSDCPLVIINNLLTVVGTRICKQFSLFSLTGHGSRRRWTVEFPPMPFTGIDKTALCTGTVLIVAGGREVAVMNIEALQWSISASLAPPVGISPAAAVCGDQVYILQPNRSQYMYTCSLLTLIHSESKDTEVWKEVAAPPVTETTCVSIHNQLLTIGGKNSKDKSTKAIHMYNPNTDSWEVISHMRRSRHHCIAAVLNYQLVVVGGDSTGIFSLPDYCMELATVEYY